MHFYDLKTTIFILYVFKFGVESKYFFGEGLTFFIFYTLSGKCVNKYYYRSAGIYLGSILTVT